MVSIKNTTTNAAIISNILTLRYNPSKTSLIPKLSWRNFTTKEITNDPVNTVEKLLIKKIKNEIKNPKLSVSLALSGGIDSALSLVLLRKCFPKINISAISVKFADSTDETKRAKKIAKKFGADIEILYIENFFNELPKALSIVKLPFWDLHWYYVVKKAKSLSKILVSGDGGDELFGGYTFRYEKFLRLISKNSKPANKIKAYLKCHERDWVPDQSKLFGPKIKFSWTRIHNHLKPFFNNPLDPLTQVFLTDFNGKLLYNWIPLYSRINDYFKVKQISPLLSKEMISFAAHVPPNLKYDMKKNTGKLILRELLKKHLSPKFLTHSKQGFSINTVNLWKSSGKRMCMYYLDNARIVEDGWINPIWIRTHMKKLESEQNVRYVNKFFGLLAFEIWYRLFITNEIKPNTKLVV